jgi:branched-chain amino acid aminotransferase
MEVKQYSYFEGKIVPAEDAKVSIQTHALQYGTAVFGGIRGYYNKAQDNLFIFRIHDHFTRLLNSAKIMQIQFDKTPQELVDITLELVRVSGYRENIYIRPYLYTSALQLSPRFHDVKADIAIYILQLNDYLDTKNGLKTMVSSWRRIDDTTIPTFSKASGGYVNSALAKSEAVQNGCDEAIFLDSRGLVSEGSAENLFLVRDGKLITPSLSSSILEGITRKSILEIARNLKIEVVERDVSRSELYISDELFFSGTGVQVAWISEVDKRKIGSGFIGSITEMIQNLFFKIVTGEEKEYMKWLVSVY